MTIVVTLYAGWITVIPKEDSIVGASLWGTVENLVVTLIMFINSLFFVWAAIQYTLELSREGKISNKFNVCIHGCHRVHGKTKSKKARRKLKKRSSIVIPSGGGSRSTAQIQQAEVNTITKVEGKLLRLARKLFSAGSPAYTAIAQIVIQISREEMNVKPGKKKLINA